MQKSDMRIDPFDDFAIQLEHQSQHTMRRRVLRAEVNGEVALAGAHTHDRAISPPRMANGEWRMAKIGPVKIFAFSPEASE
jgi:hypothetical protein